MLAVTVTAAGFFAEADLLPLADLPTLIGSGGLLVVAPHPDDESLGCGGLIAACLRSGRAVHVIIVSDGTGSHPTSAKYPHDALRDLREGEARSACSTLGLREDALTFLRLPDTAVPSKGPAVDAIAALARRIEASTIAVTWRHDPHCDHQASFALARGALAQLDGSARLLEYPVWGHTLPDETVLDAPPRGCRFDIAPDLALKRAAIAAHRSQTTRLIDDDPYGFALKPEMIARFERPFEIYLQGTS